MKTKNTSKIKIKGVGAEMIQNSNSSLMTENNKRNHILINRSGNKGWYETKRSEIIQWPSLITFSIIFMEEYRYTHVFKLPKLWQITAIST